MALTRNLPSLTRSFGSSFSHTWSKLRLFVFEASFIITGLIYDPKVNNGGFCLTIYEL